MTDLQERFQEFDEVPVPDLWERITELAAEAESTPGTSLRRRRLATAVAAAVLVLLVVGLPLLLVSGDEPGPIADGWTGVPVAAPALESIADLAAIPSGGFLALTVNPEEVLWTPDAVNWFDADPEGKLSSLGRAEPTVRFEASSVAASKNLIVVLDHDRAGVWIGDRRAEIWRFTALTTSAEADRTRLLTLAAQEDQVLVIGQVLGTELAEGTESELLVTERVVAWVIADATAAINARDLPVPVPAAIDFVEADATSFAGRWLVALTASEWQGVEGWNGSDLILALTPTGWVSSPPAQGMGDLTSISGGPSSAVVTTCHFGGDSFWHTTDGVTWAEATNDVTGHLAEYVDGLGFVIHDGAGWYLSQDGSSWQLLSQAGVAVDTYPRSGDVVAAAEGRVFEFNNQLWMWSRD